MLQMHFLNMFLGYEFSTYGIEVIKFSEQEPEDREDPMHTIFPKVTKCTFHKYARSGHVEEFDGLCVMSLNVINEKIFIALWFWLVAVACASAGLLVYRAALLFLPMGRALHLSAKVRMS